MRGVVLAAGEGTRMGPLTATRPKVLLPVGRETLLARVLRQLAAAGVEDVTVVAGYRADDVREHVGDGSRWGLHADVVLQDPPKGTGDAVAHAPEDDLLVVNGDVLLPDDALPRLARADGWAVAAAEVADPRGLGVLTTDGARVTGIAEKRPDPPSNLANAGAYRLPAAVHDLLAGLEPSPRGEVELTDALAAAIAGDHHVRAVPVEGWMDVGYPWDLLEANARVLDAMEVPAVAGTVEEGATLRGAVHVDATARIRSGAYLEGPLVVGPGCDVGPNAYLRPGTVLVGDNRVGNAVEVKASLLLRGATVGHLSYVGDSVLGAGVNLGAGTKVANLRHDDRSIRVHLRGEVVDTGRRKLGVVLGDGVHTGINTSLNVGVLLPPGHATLPGEVVMRSP